MWLNGKKIPTIILAATFAFSLLTTAFADSIEEKRQELEDAQARVREADEIRQKAQARADEASASMDEIVAELQNLQAEISVLTSQQDELQETIDVNREKLAQKKEQLEERRKIYRRRLRDIYMRGQINYLDVLLGAKDFNDFSSRMYLLQKIVKADLHLIDVVRKETAEVEARQNELDGQMAEIKRQQTVLAVKRNRADEVRTQRAALLVQAEANAREKDSEYEQMLAVSENIKNMLQSMEAAASASLPRGGSGRFMWPCSGSITSYYGWRTHPIFGTQRYHSGMDIAVDSGTPIQAADSGTVIYSGWLGGYGYAVMIDHGGGLVSLYGHNSGLAVDEGQTVEKGQVVAYAGSTGWSTGPHCHFEVRLHGEVTDPLNYLP